MEAIFKRRYDLFERSGRATKLLGFSKECNQSLGGNGGGKQMDEMGGGKFYACVGSGGDSRYSMRFVSGAVLCSKWRLSRCSYF